MSMVLQGFLQYYYNTPPTAFSAGSDPPLGDTTSSRSINNPNTTTRVKDLHQSLVGGASTTALGGPYTTTIHYTYSSILNDSASSTATTRRAATAVDLTAGAGTSSEVLSDFYSYNYLWDGASSTGENLTSAAAGSTHSSGDSVVQFPVDLANLDKFNYSSQYLKDPDNRNMMATMEAVKKVVQGHSAGGTLVNTGLDNSVGNAVVAASSHSDSYGTAMGVAGDNHSLMHLTIPVFLVFLTAFLFAVYILNYVRRPKGLPPGPAGLPILGVLPLMGKKPYLTVQRWWAQYGDVYSMYMGSRLVIVLNGIEVMKECLVKQGDKFSARPWTYFKKLTKNTGIMFTDGEVWREHRRFALSCMRDFGMGKVSLESKILEEARILTTELARHSEMTPVDFATYVPKTVSNIICSIIYGSRFDYNDDYFQAALAALDQSNRNQTIYGMIQFLPFLEFLPKVLPKDAMLMKNVKMREEYAEKQIKEHMESFDHNNPRDFIDAYLSKMMTLRRRGDPTTFEERQLKRTIQDLFIAGSETVNTTLRWGFLFMALHGEVQEQVYKEIEAVVGTSRQPTIKDKQTMPYTTATIMECQRMGNIALFSVPRCTTEDTVVNGYQIPRGTWVFVNRWGLHANKRYWPNPSKFDPRRFLNKDGAVISPEAFSPFGVGPRSCLGEVLARMELFLFFTSVLQVFKISLPEGAPLPSLEPRVGLNMSPRPYALKLTQR